MAGKPGFSVLRHQFPKFLYLTMTADPALNHPDGGRIATPEFDKMHYVTDRGLVTPECLRSALYTCTIC